MRTIYIKLILISILLCPAATLHAKKVKRAFKTGKRTTAVTACDTTTFKGLKIDMPINPKEIPPDRSLEFTPDSIQLAGYDKNVSSAVESILVTNANRNDTLEGMAFRIEYFDLNGLMLHSRNVILKCNLPPRETRIVNFSSWDKQKSYFYHKSNEPRKVSTPYKIKTTPVAYWIIPCAGVM